MASEHSMNDLLSKICDSVSASDQALPIASAIRRPRQGISLLDTKSDLFLEYLQTLVFLILVKLRARNRSREIDAQCPLALSAVERLAELRVYLDRGVRPLENRLKYQVDKVLGAADSPLLGTQSSVRRVSRPETDANEQFENDESDLVEEDTSQRANVEELSYRPDLAAFASKPSTKAKAKQSSNPDGAPLHDKYRPPRITPTALPMTDSLDKDVRRRARAVRSAAVDDYVANELSTAPVAEPSIGSTITAGGRATKTPRDKAREDERRDYEEANFTRLPRESNKERARERAHAARRGGNLGEFDLSGLGAMSDRVARATAKRPTGKRTRTFAEGARGGSYNSGYKENVKRRRQ